MIRSSARRLVVVAITTIAILLVWNTVSNPIPQTPKALSTSAGLTIDRLTALATLTTLKVDVADAMETQVKGYTGSIKAVLIVRGDVTVGVDLSAAKFLGVDDKARRAVLVLPQPKVQSVRLDHERTKLVAVLPSGLWTITPGGGDAEAFTINRAFRDGQREIAKAAEDPALIERAKNNAEQVLGCFFSAMGWKVEIRWSG